LAQEGPQPEWPPFNSPQVDAANPVGRAPTASDKPGPVEPTKFPRLGFARPTTRFACRCWAALPGRGPYISERGRLARVSSDGADKTRPNPPNKEPAPSSVAAMESTFIMIKPDGVQRGLVSIIFSQFVSVDSIRFGDARALGAPILVLT